MKKYKNVIMTLSDFNKLGKEEAAGLLFSCCGSAKWVSQMIGEFPFTNEVDLVSKAEAMWYEQCTETDWLEAFTHHPRIGDVKSLAEKFAGKEQAAIGSASNEIIEVLLNANTYYEKTFGFIFIVCATGKRAEEMLRLLHDRISNNRNEELDIAMGEQHKITIIRFVKMIDEGNWQNLKPGQLTTHVLDTSVGKPGRDISIRLKHLVKGSWNTMAQGITNKDGRIADLLPANRNVKPGNYKMVFETGNYFETNNTRGFYPEVEITFTVFDDGHYHVPLLLNPFGYSTYRGS
jgi:hydroxyisourate hydrolase